MKYHIELLLFELINLYYEVTKEESIPLFSLEKAYNIIKKLIKEKENINIESFQESIDLLQDKCPNSLEIKEDAIIIKDNISFVYSEIQLGISHITLLDQEIISYVETLTVYQALNLKIPFNKVKNYFFINEQIIKTYCLLAKYELENKNQNVLLFQLNILLTTLDELMGKASMTTIRDLRICCEAYEQSLPKDSFDTPWENVLFAKREVEKINCLKLYELLTLREIELNSQEEDREVDINREPSKIIGVPNQNIIYDQDFAIDTEEKIDAQDGTVIFLGLYLYHLNTFINIWKSTLPHKIIEKLTLKAYLLLSLPELSDIESIFIERREIASPIITKEYYSDKTFEAFTLKLKKINLNYKDQDLKNNIELYTKLIINIIFIKTYLDLTEKEEIINNITKQSFYKKEDYQIVTNLIEQFLLNDNLEYIR